jgi:RNA polymerase sigma-70 factor (ECF subfamily)
LRSEAFAAAEAAARRSWAELVALLAARTRDVAGAEDALAEAFAAALVAWPRSGVPRTPEAWLVTVARRRLVDVARRRRSAEQGAAHLALLAEERRAAARAASERQVALRSAFGHPSLDPRVRLPLLLQLAFGFDAAALGRTLRISPACMSQRLVRAKQKLREALAA